MPRVIRRSYDILACECGVPEDRIFFLPKENNWWGPAGITGPCGPDTEMFFDYRQGALRPGLLRRRATAGDYLEIWNDVFMEYNKQADGTLPAAGPEKRGYRHGPGPHHLHVLQGEASRL